MDLANSIFSLEYVARFLAPRSLPRIETAVLDIQAKWSHYAQGLIVKSTASTGDKTRQATGSSAELRLEELVMR
jgi:hypothetical protein